MKVFMSVIILHSGYRTRENSMQESFCPVSGFEFIELWSIHSLSIKFSECFASMKFRRNDKQIRIGHFQLRKSILDIK